VDRELIFTIPGYFTLTRRSLVSGQFATYETISSWGYLFAAGLGNVEHTITVSKSTKLNFSINADIWKRPTLVHA